MSIIRTSCIYVSQEMRIRGYLAKPKGVLEFKKSGKHTTKRRMTFAVHISIVNSEIVQTNFPENL